MIIDSQFSLLISILLASTILVIVHIFTHSRTSGHTQGSQVIYRDDNFLDSQHKALDYIKDFATTLLTIQTAIIAALATATQLFNDLKPIASIFLYCSLIMVLASL